MSRNKKIKSITASLNIFLVTLLLSVSNPINKLKEFGFQEKIKNGK